ncbi:ubiquinol oxidase, mitochondrial isoform X2 [Gossypium raimondii]|uniref:ubiquinol oxidase, mitochondrial isoform X2 n=1 Tax=Gossypium raimondii TaxID=29730 RepID=UPI00227CCF62|nr:ubiquinol oxidase, mitochondrial isoform X2 [Gossypium raimondii]XP_052484599.1 ubiquinol oxidase, mitochondrial isoform X2 [Gossypium raimondii]
MNRFVVRSVMRGLINGRSYCSCSSIGNGQVYRSAIVGRSLELSGQRNGVAFGGFEWRRMMSSSPASVEKATSEKEDKTENSVMEETKGKEVMAASYWGISRPKITREDGTDWPWNCFMPWETYSAELSIDLKKRHVPKNFVDKFAFRIVKLLRLPTDIFFQRRYGSRAMMLETVAAVPGMVGGMLLHLKSLRKFQQSGGWIKALLEEAENERMHLMTMVELVKPKWYERLLVLTVQGVFFNAFFVLYMLSPKLAHRIVGYLEEEAIHSYTEYLKDIESGAIENVAAPAIAIDYWRLPKDARLKEVITVIRADEAHHRDVNHFASDIHFAGKELKDAPAPLGYH